MSFEFLATTGPQAMNSSQAMNGSLVMNGATDMTIPSMLAEESFFHRMFFFNRGATVAASETDDLAIWLWWFCLIWFVVLMGMMAFFVIKFRRKKGQIAQASTSHNTPLEIAWTVIPTLMLVYIFFQGFRGYVTKMVAPGEAIELNLIGQQWAWSMIYPNGVEIPSPGAPLKLIGSKESPIFYVPADVPVRLRMNSKDVMHAFWVPDFRTKQDLLPNRYTTMWFQPTMSSSPTLFHPKNDIEAKASKTDYIADLAGVPYEDHYLFCAEYCGNEHSEMAATIRVVPYEAWKKWLTYMESPAGLPLIDVGAFIWKTKCASCHSIDGTAGTGPTWKHMYGDPVEFTDGTSGMVDDDYIRESIRYPSKKIVKGFGPNMPVIALKDEQILGLIEFMKSKSKGGGAASTDKPAEKK